MEIPGYKITDELGRGGMSRVYLAIQESFDREVALKIMLPELLADPTFSDRFLREAKIVGQLSHPHIVAVFDVGVHENMHYISMSYHDDGDLKGKIESGISPVQTLSVVQQIASALDFAHKQGFVHRDIKPENVLFRKDGTVVLSDFGISKSMNSKTSLTSTGTTIGTPRYMSPEQAGGKSVDGRADLYSLGVMFFEMLTGKLPYDAEDSIAIAVMHVTAPLPDLPDNLTIYQPLLNMMMAKNPDDRFQSGNEIVKDVNIYLNNQVNNYSGSTGTELIGATPLSISNSQKTLAVSISQQQAQIAANIISHKVADKSSDRTTLFQQSGPQVVVGQKVKKWFSRNIVLLSLVFFIFSGGGFYYYNNNNSQIIQNIVLQDIKQNNTSTIKKLVLDSSTINKLPQKRDKIISIPIELTSQQSGSVRQEGKSIARHFLKIELEPVNARVKILNSKMKYFDGVKLDEGKYQLLISLKGYKSIKHSVYLNNDLRLSFSLKKLMTVKVAEKSGLIIQDKLMSGGSGPEMVILPIGSFSFGSPQSEYKRSKIESLPTNIKVKNKIAIGRYEVSQKEYFKYTSLNGLPDHNVRAKGNIFSSVFNLITSDDSEKGLPDMKAIGKLPASYISWRMANAYAKWLSRQTGKVYRLPTEQEWEYAARAGSSTTFYSGKCMTQKEANFDGRSGFPGCAADTVYLGKSVNVGTYRPNNWGLYDMSGNVWEWTASCFNERPGLTQTGDLDYTRKCKRRVLRGGGFNIGTYGVRSAHRYYYGEKKGTETTGFRLVREMGSNRN